MSDWSEHVRLWEERLREVDNKIADANSRGMDGRRIFGQERDNILSQLGNAKDLARG